MPSILCWLFWIFCLLSIKTLELLFWYPWNNLLEFLLGLKLLVTFNIWHIIIFCPILYFQNTFYFMNLCWPSKWPFYTDISPRETKWGSGVCMSSYSEHVAELPMQVTCVPSLVMQETRFFMLQLKNPHAAIKTKLKQANKQKNKDALC